MNTQMYISKAAARQRFDELCLKKNAEMPLITVTRQLEIDGKSVTQTYHRRKKAISDGAQSTGKALIQSYAFQFARLVKDLPADILNGSEPPSLKTNNVKMAKFRGGLADRTIRNHLKELKSIGVISKYKFHGSKANFELWISPEVIFGQESMPEIFDPATVIAAVSLRAETSSDTATPTPQFSPASATPQPSTIDTNFPHRHPVSIETKKDTKNTTTSKVEKHSTIRRPEDGNHRHAAPQGPKQAIMAGSMETSGGGGGPKIYVDNTPKSWISDLDVWKTPGIDRDYERLPRAYQHYVAHFWDYARKSLWPSKVFIPQEEFAAMNTITAGVYQKVFAQNPGEKNLDKFQKLLFKAIDKASAYYKKSEKYYPGDPYARFKEGTGYFDAVNPKGFQVAYRWAFKDAAAQHEKYGEKVLADAIRHLKNHHSGQIPKRLQHLTALELYRHYETKISQKYSKDLLSDFYKQALTLPIFR